MQDEQSPSYMFDDTDSSSNIQTNNVSQPTSDDPSNKPFSVDENRYKILYLYRPSIYEHINCMGELYIIVLMFPGRVHVTFYITPTIRFLFMV